MKILNSSGFRSLHSIDPSAAKESYGGLKEKDGADWVYMGLSKEASQHAALSDGIMFIVNGSEHAARTVVQPDQEKGIALIQHHMPKSSIVGIIATQDTPATRAVLKRWEELKHQS